MKIEVKSYKEFKEMSRETNSFTANLYVEGKPFAIVQNDGWGGPDLYTPHPKFEGNFAKFYKEVDSFTRKTNPALKTPHGDIEIDLSLWVSREIENQYRRKELKKVLKKIAYFHEGSIYTFPAKFKPTEEYIEKVKKGRPEVQVLNDMPFEEALELYKRTFGLQ